MRASHSQCTANYPSTNIAGIDFPSFCGKTLACAILFKAQDVIMHNLECLIAYRDRDELTR